MDDICETSEATRRLYQLQLYVVHNFRNVFPGLPQTTNWERVFHEVGFNKTVNTPSFQMYYLNYAFSTSFLLQCDVWETWELGYTEVDERSPFDHRLGLRNHFLSIELEDRSSTCFFVVDIRKDFEHLYNLSLRSRDDLKLEILVSEGHGQLKRTDYNPH